MLRIEGLIAQAGPAQVAEIADIVGDHIPGKAGDVVSDAVMAPFDFLAYTLHEHFLQLGYGFGGEKLGFFFLQLQDNIAEQP